MNETRLTRAALRKGCPSCGDDVRHGVDIETQDTREGIRQWEVSFLYCPCCGLQGAVTRRTFVGVLPWDYDGGQRSYPQG